MTLRAVLGGSADVSVVIRIVDATDGTPETGVVAATSGLALTYTRDRAAPAAITESDLAATDSAHSDGGMKHLGDGYYRVDLPDAAVAAGVAGVLVHGSVTGMVVIGCYLQIVAYNPGDGVRLGLTALPNAAADAAGGLPISDAGGLDLDAQRADVAAILVDTGTTLDGRIPAALQGGRMDSHVGSVGDAVLTAAKFAAGAFDAVWSVAARVLTAGTNIALAKGTGVTGFNDLDAAGVRGAVGLASANLDTQLSTIGGVADDVKAKTDNLPTDPADQSLIIAATDAVMARLGAPVGASLSADLQVVDGVADAIKAKTDPLPASPAAVGSAMTLTSGERNAVADALLDRGDAIEAGWTLRKVLRVLSAVLCGKISGAGTTTNTFRDLTDTKDRVTATVDANGNRSAVTLDGT